MKHPYYKRIISVALALSAFLPAVGFMQLISRSSELLNSYPAIGLIYLLPSGTLIAYFKLKIIKNADILAFAICDLSRSNTNIRWFLQRQFQLMAREPKTATINDNKSSFNWYTDIVKFVNR